MSDNDPIPFHAFTITTRARLAYVRVLAEDLARQDPGAVLHVLVLDDPEPRAVDRAVEESFRRLWPTELMAPAEVHALDVSLTRRELVAVLRPYIVRHLLDGGAGAVLCLDAATALFASLEPLAERAREHGLVLAPCLPKRATPCPRELRDAGTPDLGVYDPGCFAVSRRAQPALDWWIDRARRLVYEPRGALGDESRWLDVLATYFAAAILDDPAVDVAPWNLCHRELDEKDGEAQIDGRRLRSFQFSDFDPARPHLLTGFLEASPKILLSEHPPLARMTERYAERLLAHGHQELVQAGDPIRVTADGVPIDRRITRICRDAMSSAQERSGVFPDPFDPSTAGDFTAWLQSPDPAMPSVFSRYLNQVYLEEAYLHDLFPDLLAADVPGYSEWLERWASELDPPVPARLMPESGDVGTPSRRPAAADPLEHGVNLIGYMRAESGVGEVGRLLAATLTQAGIPHAVIPFEQTLSRQQHPFAHRGATRPLYDVNLICVNADQLPLLLARGGPEILAERYTIGVWAWEVEELPEPMRASGDLVDEVWGISRHTADAIAPFVACPVTAFPLPVAPPDPPPVERRDLDLPDAFLVLFCFDFDSVFERKNPVAVVEAFRRAFAPGEAHLLVKSINGERHLPELECLRWAARGRGDIEIRDGYLPAERQAALTAQCDVYMSLHRAEGFGLTLAEAMAFARPVIATAYSANLDFMTEDNAWLVPYRLVPVGEGHRPYPAAARWADPDIDMAARHLRHVFEHRDEAAARGRRARDEIRDLHGPRARAEILARRLDQAHRLRFGIPL